jgi:hypothetical protein
MTAAAAAWRLTTALVGEPSSAREGAVAVALAAGAGLVEGVALGIAQARGLAGYLTPRARRRWVQATCVVAVAGWALASLPSTVMAADAGPEPPRLLTIAGGAGLGALMGLAMGGAQSLVLRGQVARPGRWVVANVLAWAPAMAVLFTAASTPEASWPTVSVVGLGAGSGVVAGALVGALTAPYVVNGRLRRAQPPAVAGISAR